MRLQDVGSIALPSLVWALSYFHFFSEPLLGSQISHTYEMPVQFPEIRKWDLMSDAWCHSTLTPPRILNVSLVVHMLSRNFHLKSILALCTCFVSVKVSYYFFRSFFLSCPSAFFSVPETEPILLVIVKFISNTPLNCPEVVEQTNVS